MADGQLFTWESLATVSSSALLVFLFVQYTKAVVDKYVNIPTDIYAIAVSFTVVISTQAAIGSNMHDWKVYVLSFFNSFIIASTSAHLHAKTINPPKPKPKKRKPVKQDSPPTDEKPSYLTPDQDDGMSMEAPHYLERTPDP